MSPVRLFRAPHFKMRGIFSDHLRMRFHSKRPKASTSFLKLSVFSAFILLSYASCAGAPPERPSAPPERPALPQRIMGAGSVDADTLAAFLLASNPSVDPRFARELAGLYVEEAAAEGVVHEVAFAQMCLETGFLRFGGLVTADMHNYCGLGSIGPGQSGERFPSARIGVRAHVQHLKGYATGDPLKGAIVDPRYRWIKYGSAPSIPDLAGRWASDVRYGEKILTILMRLYDFAYA